MAIVSNRNLTPWQLRPLASNEIAANGGFTHVSTITANDLTTTTADTAQTFTLATLKSGDVVFRVYYRMKVAFKDASDAAFVALSFSAGQTGTTTTWINAIQVNELGTEVFTAGSTGTNPIVYNAANTLTATFSAPTSGKNVNDIDIGEIEVFVELGRLPVLEKAATATPMTK